jgi:RecA-family ATPase
MPTETRKVLYLSCEDRADVLHWRLARICDLEEITADQLTGLHIVDLVGHDSILYRRDPQAGSGVTAAFTELRHIIATTGANVIFVDGIADTFGDSENDRSAVKSFINALVSLIGVDGSVVLVHHVAKPTANYGATSEGYSGSTSWHNSVRARWYLHPETERTDDGAEPTGNLILELQKSNLGRKDQQFRFRWDDQCHLFVAEGKPSRVDREQRDEHEQWAIERALHAIIEAGDYCPAATTGQRTAYHVLSAAAEFPDTLKGGSSGNRRRFWRHIEALRRMGVVVESSIRRKNRTSVNVLTLKAAPDKDCTNAHNA